MKTLTIGLTGGIGSGKTYVSKILMNMGIPVYNSDDNAKRLMVENKEVIASIISLLGDEAYTKEKDLNKAHISAIIFKNPKKRIGLNKIVHPAVRKDFKRYVKEHKMHPFVINEAALFVENGSYKDFDKLISVIAPMPLRIERIKKRDKSKADAILARMSAQSTDEEKISVSDYVIYNDASDNLLRQISEIHSELITFVKKRNNDRHRNKVK